MELVSMVGVRWVRDVGRLALVLGASLMAVAPLVAAEPPNAASVLQDLRSFREMGSVLLIAAHPDDENTQLITYFARGRGYRMAYLSVTRGDGGQNVLGPEFGDELGVIRTQELLAARRLDGGRQFFTRAIDFGFSKDAHETLSIWDRQAVLGDVVRVIRTFRPDVVLTRFSPDNNRTHGHHTASAILGVEAFKLAGDPKAFPEQLTTLAVWQPKRVMLNGGGPRGAPTDAPGLHVDIGGTDPVLGIPFGQIAGQSRAMHKSQGFGNFGGGGGGGQRTESFVLLGGEPATTDIMDGVDTTWARIPGGAELIPLVTAAIDSFHGNDLSANVPALLEIRKKLSALPNEPLVVEKRQQLDRILQACLGLTYETTVTSAEVVPGETFDLQHSATVAGQVPVRWVAVRYPTTQKETTIGEDLKPRQAVQRQATQTLPISTPITQPYWLRGEGKPGLFRVDDPALIGRPENPPAFPVEQVFEVGGQTLVLTDEPIQAGSGATAESRRPLDVIQPVALQFASQVRLFAPGQSKSVEVKVTAFRPGVAGMLRLELPSSWKAEPSERPFHLMNVGQQETLSFQVTAPTEAATGEVGAAATVGGATYRNGRVELHYSHIPHQLLQPPATAMLVSLDLVTRGHRVGYLPGAGDSIAEAMEEMGYEVKTLSGPQLTPEGLQGLDAVVVGIRALNVRKDLADNMANLFAYAENGGTVIVQYNRPEGLQTKTIAPYDLHLTSLRVTDENAPVRFLAPEHPVLNVPNKITSHDFMDWVQERGIYYPDHWDSHFTPILSAADPNEQPLDGGLLIAQHGKGHYVYTSLVWFRELPAGVPGAYRLFANLLSLGKPSGE